MFSVVREFGDDLEVYADDYEIDQDGDLVFLSDEGEDGEMVEIGRMLKGHFAGVFQMAEGQDDEDEDEDFDDAE